jgi:peptidoglycan hydrolase-like protein with peptidoglycan-binding domain
MTATVDDSDMRRDTPITVVLILARLFRRRPGDSIAVLVVLAASLSVVINALCLQSGPHPAPIFNLGSRPVASGDVVGSVVMAPRPRPSDFGGPGTDGSGIARPRVETIADLQRELERRGFYDGPIDGVDGPKTDAAIRDFVQAAGLKWSGDIGDEVLRQIARSPFKAPGHAAGSASIAHNDTIGDMIITSSRRVLAVQRALSDFGYGPVKPTGLFGPDTKAAIEKFERDRKLPVTGQISDRLLRELAAVTGRPLE